MSGATIRKHALELDVAALSEQGPRSENQDAYLVDLERGDLVAVADGMGGERGGRLAADLALRAVAGAAPLRSLDEARSAVRMADRSVAAAAAEDTSERAGMGCALGVLGLVSTRLNGPGWVAAHVGDVRILSRAPDGTVRLETRDHTPAFQRWEAGEVELDEVADTPGANRLQRAVGRGGEADVTWIPARPGWTYAIVSDGITKAMRLDELGEALSTSAAEACAAIRRKVEARGPDDNYTAVVVRIGGGPAAPPPSPAHSAAEMKPTNSPWAIAALLLSLLALAAAGYAVWDAREGRTDDRATVDRLRLRVDTLESRVAEVEEPFGPAAPESMPLRAQPEPRVSRP